MGNVIVLPACADAVRGDSECRYRCSNEEQHHASVEVDDPEDVFKVFLNVYDLNHDWVPFNHALSDILRVGGAFHTAVEVHGQEWSYGMEGVRCAEPRRHDVHVYRQTLLIGLTQKSKEQVHDFMERAIMAQWDGDDYDLINHNCCNFTDAVLRHLTGCALPPWVNRLARIAECANDSVGEILDSASMHGSLPDLLMGDTLSTLSDTSAHNLLVAGTLSTLSDTSTAGTEVDLPGCNTSICRKATILLE
eukprot:TRINITY_DN59619_c0_g1_i1.p1 TRINITY_DN59619_c0_g1~~TRINITY_DN59619_c0_g1_i1.p1  ORF type:complete len:249 (-),score=34.42 TRINITY_DN59619_c0_g1_i1:263-1009(-)